MPTKEITNLKQRDYKTLKRIDAAKRSSILLRSFFEKGFRSFEALYAIVLQYYPEVAEQRLLGFWHFRVFDEEIYIILETVFEKLKSE